MQPDNLHGATVSETDRERNGRETADGDQLPTAGGQGGALGNLPTTINVQKNAKIAGFGLLSSSDHTCPAEHANVNLKIFLYS